MALKLKTAPATHPVSLAEVKSALRIDSDDANENTYLHVLIDAATNYLDAGGYLGFAIITQTWELHLDSFSDQIMLPLGPVASVTSVKYYDPDNLLQTVDPSEYAVDNVSDPAWLVLASGASWPATASGLNNVVIEYVAGAATAPAAIKQAILLLIAQWFTNRENAGARIDEMPHAVTSLLTNYRRHN